MFYLWITLADTFAYIFKRCRGIPSCRIIFTNKRSTSFPGTTCFRKTNIFLLVICGQLCCILKNSIWSLIYKGGNSYNKKDNSALEQERRASFEPQCWHINHQIYDWKALEKKSPCCLPIVVTVSGWGYWYVFS